MNKGTKEYKDWLCKQVLGLVEKSIEVEALTEKDLHDIGEICLQACYRLDKEQKK